MRLTRLIPTVALCISTGALYAADSDSPEKSTTYASTSATNATEQTSSEQSEKDLKVTESELDKQVTDANKASKFIGMTVKNKQGENLGIIKDLALDLKAGKIGYAVLSHGGWFGYIGGKYVAVPIQALTLKPGEKALLLDLPKQQLAQAPGFDDNNWPTLDAAAKGKTIGLARSSPSQGGTDSDARTVTGTGSYSDTNSVTSSTSLSSDTNSATGGATLQEDEAQRGSDQEHKSHSDQESHRDAQNSSGNK